MQLNKLSIKTHTIILTLLLALLAFAFDATIQYYNGLADYNQIINDKLTTAATMARGIVGENFHDSIVDSSSITEEGFKNIVKKYNSLCLELNLESLWSVMLINNEAVFTTTTSANKDFAKPKHANFFDTHPNQQLYKNLFNSGRSYHNQTLSKWRNIHFMLIPYVDSNGRQYAFGAAITGENYNATFFNKIRYKLLEDILLIIPLFALYYLLISYLTKPLSKISDYVKNFSLDNITDIKELTPSGVEEYTVLANNINYMRQTIINNFETIQNQEKNLHTTLMSIGDGVIVANSNGKITRINPEAERLTGWSKTAAIGQPLSTVFNIINKDSSKPCVSPFEMVLKTSKIYELEKDTILINKDGTTCHISNSAAPIFAANNILSGVVLCFRDITREYLQEENIKQNHSKLLEIQKQAKIGYWEYSIKDDTFWISEEIGNLYGINKVGILSEKDLKAYQSAEKRDSTNLTLLEKIRRGKILHEVQEITNLLTNKKLLLETYAKPSADKSGIITKIVGITKDVTEQQAILDQLHHSQKLDAIGQLAGGVAHDFNNMLGGILGFTELISNEVKGNKKLESYCQQIINTSENAADLTQQLLSFARKGKAISTPINLHYTIKSAMKLLSRSITKEIIVKTELCADSAMIIGDPSQLESAIINLGINARDAMPDGGYFTVSTENIFLNQDFCNATNFDIEPGKFILVKARDTGIGMSPETINRIFEPFFTTKSIGKGTGLGLSAIFGAITTHHGAIAVYSEINRGTEFHFYLPLAESIGTENYQDDTLEEELNGNAHILVVDDEKVIRTMVEALLEDLGYIPILAKNGKEAIELYKKHSNDIELVILDVVMPVMSGMECMQELLKLNPQLKIIIASGFSKSESAADFISKGAIDFINKPYRQRSLALTIKEILNK